MRVTNSMLVSNFMNDLNTNMTKLSDLQSQLASGKKYAHISDDPVAVIYSQQARYKLTVLSHYQENVSLAGNWLTQAEEGAMSLNDLLASAYESCIDAATDIKNSSDLTNVSFYLAELRDQILQTLNSTLGDKYVYGGYNTTGYTENGKPVPPFTVNDDGNLCYNGVDLTSTDPDTLALIEELRSDVLTFDISIGSSMEVTVNGIDLVFYGTDPDTGANLNIYNLLDDLYNVVSAEGTTAEDINSFISDLQSAQSHVLGITAQLGGRANRIEILSSRYEQDLINYTQMLSDAEDADYSEIIMKYKMAEAVYNASLAAGAYIIQPTLMDFLS